MEIDAEKSQIKAPIKLVIAVTAAFIFWWISTYIIPLQNDIITLKERQAKTDALLEGNSKRIDRLEDRFNHAK